jgi:hypothetical protein
MLVRGRIRRLAEHWLALALLAGVNPAHAQQDATSHPHFIFPLCFERLGIIKAPLIRVGCETIDCCPGCPKAPIEWRILVEGPLHEVSLQFENLAVSPAKLSLQGPARWRAGTTTVVVGRGESRIRGLPGATTARTARARPQVHFDTAAARRSLTGAVPAAAGGPSQAEARILIEQLVGGILVNERVILYRLRQCLVGPPRPLTDRIALSQNASSDNAVVFLDARRSGGCVNDEVNRGAALVPLGSVLSNDNCRSEAAVFSDDDAVQLVENVTVWTNALGDRLPIDLSPGRWQPTIDVWSTQDALLTRAQNEMATADLLLNTNHAGIDVLARATHRLVTGANATIINTAAGDSWNVLGCRINSIKSTPAIYNKDHLNVYFANQPFTGFRCENVIMIGTEAEPESLAHEFGHAFSLSHTDEKDYDNNGANDFGPTNIMWPNVGERTTFSEGQCFRMTLNPTSLLNALGVRTSGPTRACPDAAGPWNDSSCPWIALDEPN